VTPERWQQIERVFEQALALPEQERETFLNRVCHGDNELRREAESLLESHDHANELLERPSLFLPDEALAGRRVMLEPGQIIGRYRIVKELGRGGMGQVYLAARADAQYEKHVALKLIKRGMDSDSVLRQFRNERQILASFDHPNIARLLDADTTDEGLPYFVMEYVEGVSIDKYSDRRDLNVTARVDLFRQVCSAVSYAHRHLVIHRDIKPSNILITDDGMPKLLDFGIAKILQRGPEGVPTATATGLRLMTPEYASPEQVQGLTVTTVSDVYSLGVVLYELLTGHAPYQFKTRSLFELARAITESIPQRPSDAIEVVQSQEVMNATAESGETDRVVRMPEGSPARLRKRLQGDLDNIVLTALRKEPERRYQSVEQFSEDLRRHLAGLPVSARKDTLGYRGAKFIRRNRIAAAAAALVLLFLVGGIIATTWQARRARAQEAVARVEKARAERRFNEVRQLAHAVLFDYHDAIKDLPGATKVRERLVKDALAYLDVLSAEAGEDPSLKRELAAAYDRVGDVRGQAYSANLGDNAGALESYQKALQMREALVACDPHNIQNKRELASSYRKVGNRLLETSEAGSGLENLGKSLALYVQLANEQPADAGIRYDLADIYNDIGLAFEDWGDIANALAHHRKALPIREQFITADPSPQHRRDLSVTYVNLGRALFFNGEVKEALESNQKGLILRASLSTENPTNADYRRLLAISYQNDGDYRALIGDTNGALDSFRKKLALDEQSMAADPANAQARADFGYSCERLAELLITIDANSQAVTYGRKALSVWEQLLEHAPDSQALRSRMIKAHASLGLANAKLGDRRAALAESSQAVALLEISEDDATQTQVRVLKAEAWKDVGETHVLLAAAARVSAERLAQWQRARNMYQRSLDVWLDLRQRGIINGVDSSKPEEIQRELAKCDANLLGRPSVAAPRRN